jgi:hypothetical protein
VAGVPRVRTENLVGTAGAVFFVLPFCRLLNSAG